jgi:hypothetical protein
MVAYDLKFGKKEIEGPSFFPILDSQLIS